jgi:hypothetical protein
MKDDWALVVGINHYPFAGVNPLAGAVHDAKEFCKWLTDPKGGDVPNGSDEDDNHVVLLTSPTDTAAPGPPKPTYSQILSFFEELLVKLGNASGRRLYIYLSGHGISPAGQVSVRNTALLMANAKAPNLWHNFTANIWAEGARSTARFREVVLIMDCCRDLKNNAVIMPHIFGDSVPDSKDCYLIEAYATAWGSKARELPFPPGGQMRGVFTRSLLEVLWSGRMTGTMLKASVRKHLTLVLKDEKKAQEPQIDRDEDLDRIVFNEQADPPRTLVTITGHPAARPEIDSWPEGTDNSVPVNLGDWTHDGASWQGKLEPGQYILRLPTGGSRRLKILAGVPEEVTL